MIVAGLLLLAVVVLALAVLTGLGARRRGLATRTPLREVGPGRRGHWGIAG